MTIRLNSMILSTFAIPVLLVIVAIAQTANAASINDFTGAYETQNWSSSGISGGTTSITPALGSATEAEFAYNVFLGNPSGGVSYRTADYTVTAEDTGTVSFDYKYDIFHAFFDVEADFFFVVNGSPVQNPVDFYNLSYTGAQTFSGNVTANVNAGDIFGFRIGGSNFDSNSTLNGTLSISNFSAPGTPVPEPTTYALFALGAGALGIAHRRKLRKANK